MKQQAMRRFGLRATVAFFVGMLWGASYASAAPLILVSGKVCDHRASTSVRAPEPGEVRCARGQGEPGNVRVTLIGREGHTVTSTRTRRNGDFRLRARPGTYTLEVEGGGYNLKLRIGRQSLKNIDLIRGIIF